MDKETDILNVKFSFKALPDSCLNKKKKVFCIELSLEFVKGSNTTCWLSIQLIQRAPLPP